MNKRSILFETIITVVIFVVAVIIFYPREEQKVGSSEKLVLSISLMTKSKKAWQFLNLANLPI